MRILHIAIQLLKDYQFLSFPLPFEKYQINAGQYRLTTLKVVTYSLTTPLIQSCRTDSTLRVYKLFVKIITTLRAFMAGNNSQLCMHLSVTTDEHFCFMFNLQFLHLSKYKVLVRRWIQVAVHRRLRFLLKNEIPNYPMRYLNAILQVIFNRRGWCPTLKDSNATTRTQSYLTSFRIA